MATPQDLLVKAKSRMGQAGGGGGQPNTGGSRGAPGRGGIAARPAVGGGLQARRLPRPGAEPALDGDMMAKPMPSAPPEPAWKQLQAAGFGGQGSAAANRAKLAELQLGGPGAGGIIAPDQVPGAPPMPGAGQQDLARDSMSADLTRTFPGFKPRPGADPAPMMGGPAPLGGPRPQGRMPVENIMDMDGPPAGPPGGGGGGGFGDIAAVAAPYAAARAGGGVANRFQPRVNPLR